MITIVTGFSPSGYEQYGKMFIDRFFRYWPPGTNIVIYNEEPLDLEWGGCVNRWNPAGLKAFIDKHSAIPEHCGIAPVAGWQKKHVKTGYCYRFDAVRFCWQLFYPEDAAEHLRDGDLMVWLDGDVITTSEASTSFMEQALQDHDICHLGRETQSELGFWAVRLNSETRKFLFDLAQTYRSERVFSLKEWHSGFVFDDCLKRFKGRVNNLTAGDKGNVWIRTPLARFSTHLKGRLKENM